ncbi:MAG: alkaline phosphatase [Gammaproteobacteria bacterium]
MLTRRRFLVTGIGLVALHASSRARAAPRFEADPFALGVASGYPTPHGVTLWTRLAPHPLAPAGGMPATDVDVHWEVARDDRFREVVRRGTARAEPTWGHSVHVDVTGLAPDRAYCYRFRAGNALSTVGRTRTAPAVASSPRLLRLALCSCQHYEHGHYAAYRQLVSDDPDLVVHVGDYIYEGSYGPDKVRQHAGPDPRTLEEYRTRYACYRLDPALQRAHAACPWVAVWDDHEVENDYARDRSEYDADTERFLARRVAGYRAYYEHLPLPARMRPGADGMRIYTALDWGRLARIALLDTRQYRGYAPCWQATHDEFGRACGVREDPAATLLGAAQETWLDDALRASHARWNIIAQQVLMARSDLFAGPREQLPRQSWDGYPAARLRLFDALARHAVPNPVVLSGDVHSYWINDLRRDFLRPETSPVAAEIVTTSISSRGMDEDYIREVRRDSPHVKFATGRFRGYTRIDVTPARATADLRAVVRVQDPTSLGFTLSSWVVEAGRPGIQRA